MRVKICGLTRYEDAALANDLGAWALGFIFYPQSKRYVTPDAARLILASLPQGVRSVGVFVNQTDEAIALSASLPLAAIQLHGDETPDDCARVRGAFKGGIIKAFRPEKEDDLKAIPAYKDAVDYILLDTASKGEWGGSGRTGDWDLAMRAAALGIPLILAGGLSADNIASAAKKVDFFAADLSSGVEAAPGIKDAEKMKKLFAAAKDI